ncbi:hypothetical protein [Evansella clarkii]|uniref:hypothetical protein n=1 Tax=Evansella clarkii TaxID=79879 RepID=UPI000997B648|nr:hypothetical protein [Evansella clarkii]
MSKKNKINNIKTIVQNANGSKSIRKNLYNERSLEEKIKNRNNKFLLGLGSFFALLVGYIVVFNFESYQLDMTTLLTVLLAFFSIYLSSIFYFKTTEQSNKFYDRSYNHTRDIANTLSSMEGKFWEALKNIEGNSSRLNQRFDTLHLVNAGTQD